MADLQAHAIPCETCGLAAAEMLNTGRAVENTEITR